MAFTQAKSKKGAGWGGRARKCDETSKIEKKRRLKKIRNHDE